MVTCQSHDLPLQCPLCVPEPGKVDLLMTKLRFPLMFIIALLVAMDSVSPEASEVLPKGRLSL